MTEHPITPPPELMRQWLGMPRSLALEAAYRAGADQELEACGEWLKGQGYPGTAIELRDTRRPKPKSQSEEALEALDDAVFRDDIINQSAQWGCEQRAAVNEAKLQKARDEEREVCCKAVERTWVNEDSVSLDEILRAIRTARRPKPKGQAEEALGLLNEGPASDLCDHEVAVIRRALERLQELEGEHPPRS